MFEAARGNDSLSNWIVARVATATTWPAARPVTEVSQVIC